MDYEKVENRIHRFLEEKLEQAGAKGYVIGVSGGLDSAVTATLAVEAVGAENVYGWVMPGDPSDPENMKDARDLCNDLGISFREIDIEDTLEQFKSETPFSVGTSAEGNLRARIRMVYEYIDANKNNLMVLGSGNKTENQIGYFTKYGDGGVDVSPLADLYKTEVKELADYLGLDIKFIEKKPTAGLWEGQTDEGELGASYETIDKILKRLLEKEQSVEKIVEETEIPEEKVRKFSKMNKTSSHKRTRPDSPELRK